MYVLVHTLYIVSSSRFPQEIEPRLWRLLLQIALTPDLSKKATVSRLTRCHLEVEAGSDGVPQEVIQHRACVSRVSQISRSSTYLIEMAAALSLATKHARKDVGILESAISDAASNVRVR